MSPRKGMNCTVNTRPTIFWSGCRTLQPSRDTNWFGKPLSGSTACTSSAMRFFSLLSISSGTFGLPSGKRSYGFLLVYLINCSGVH